MTTTSPARGWLEITRMSNAPTVVTSVLVGAAIARVDLQANAPTIIGLCVAMVMLYVAGMILNDVMDVLVDREERPQRPIPSGRVDRTMAAAVTFGLMAFALGLMAPFGWRALSLTGVLIALIVAYNVLHQRGAWSVVLMGACRGMIPVITAITLAHETYARETLVWMAGALTLYIVVLSVIARVEAQTDDAGRGRLAPLLPMIALLPVLAVTPSDWMIPIVAAGAMAGWLLASIPRLRRTPPEIGPAVGMWLAGLCLVDAFWLALLDQPVAAGIAVAAFVVTYLLQRVVPAT